MSKFLQHCNASNKSCAISRIPTDLNMLSKGKIKNETNSNMNVNVLPSQNLLNMESYKCDICETEFSDQSQLDIHLKSIHERYSCDICEMKFGTLQKMSSKRHPIGR